MTDHKTNVLNEDTNDLSNQTKYADRVRLLLSEKEKRLGRKLAVLCRPSAVNRTKPTANA